ncbi:hypothetical protein GCM10010377_80950 [Streptomyces viridiviolaceus]|uniref:Transposase n=1 Tax=Streptomyces viridiviolaceus TaxID=68282 RepID=A0ABW2EBE3_9ACTN|nr:hypothetical protein [Streptomyces viridiviolaceus]GHB78688.1 hypothetical protein GCM10010377_80950 [Streptomyces viridiviolaceus]
MTEPGAVDLIHLEDADGDRCIVRVTGRYKHDALTTTDLCGVVSLGGDDV